MLIPYVNTKFADVSSRDLYARTKELKDSNFNGCLSITFPDHESVIFYVEGKPVTAMQEYNRWITLGDDLIEPVENKALNVNGRMAAYELPPEFLHIFIHKHVATTVNGELGSYLSVSTMARNFKEEHSTCLIKVRDKQSRGYVFINFGEQVGAAFESAEGKAYDDNAMKAMGNLRGKARVSVFFLELLPSYIKAPTPKPAAIPKPVEPDFVVETPKPMEATQIIDRMPNPADGLNSFTIEAPKPVSGKEIKEHTPNPSDGIKSIAYVLDKPSPASEATVPPQPQSPSQLKLIVVMSGDNYVGLQHRSKLMMLEALNEESVAWVDRKTIASLGTNGDHKASLVLASGKEYPVTLREAEFVSEESKFIILPRKLRNHLAVGKGAMIGVKA